jgi:hypothetical protein
MKKVNEVTVETPTALETQVNEVVALGRPVDPNSKRQIMLAEREAKRQNGELKKGRPVIETSKRQETLKKRQDRMEVEGSLKKGRPKMTSTLAETDLLQIERVTAK